MQVSSVRTCHFTTSLSHQQTGSIKNGITEQHGRPSHPVTSNGYQALALLKLGVTVNDYNPWALAVNKALPFACPTR